jgi:hypothetical protein
MFQAELPRYLPTADELPCSDDTPVLFVPLDRYLLRLGGATSNTLFVEQPSPQFWGRKID